MTNASELLPCPFCGSEPEITSSECSDDKANYGDCYIDCPTCHVEQPWRATKEDAITAWNTRQVTQLEAQLAEVREVVSLASRTLKIITGELEQAGGGRSATADDVIGICDALLTQSKEPKS